MANAILLKFVFLNPNVLIKLLMFLFNLHLNFKVGSFCFFFQNKQIFSILGYFPIISKELKNRGWVEKRDPHRPPINYSQYLKSSRKYFISIHIFRSIAFFVIPINLIMHNLYFKHIWLIGSNHLH